MAVVKQIENLEDDKFEIVIRKTRCDIYITENKVREMLLNHTTLKNKRLAVWRVIVEFLNWYKDNKPKEESFLFKQLE